MKSHRGLGRTSCPRLRRLRHGWPGLLIITSLASLSGLSDRTVDEQLTAKSKNFSTRSLKLIHSIPNRSVRKAMACDRVRRNIVELCDALEGREGHPSEALTLAQAKAAHEAARNSEPRIAAYIVLSLATRARTEDL